MSHGSGISADRVPTTRPAGGAPSGVNGDYDSVGGEKYHAQRCARGVGLLEKSLRRAMAAGGLESFAQVNCLSLGAGTAAPQQALCQKWKEHGYTEFPTFHLSDYSDTQLRTAVSNLEPFDAVGQTWVLDLTKDDIPMEDASVDFVDCTHVLHHLTHGDRYCERLAHVFSETRRVLKPTGVFALTSMDPTNCRKSRWFTLAGSLSGMEYSLDPGRLYGAHCPRLDVVIGRLRDAGFLVTGMDLIRDEPLIEPELYFDPPTLLARVKAGDVAGSSFFVLARNSGVWEDWLEAVEGLIADGSIHRVVEESERWRKLVGQAYYLEASPELVM